MKQMMLVATALVPLMASASAWAENNSPAAPAAPSQATSGRAAAREAVLTDQDRRFARDASAGGKAEVEAGRLAEQKAGDPAVQEFGRWMVTDHRALDKELTAIAKREGLAEASSQPTGSQQSQLQRLRGLSGNQFDRQYMQDQLRDHETTVALFENEAKAGKNRVLIRFADGALPMLREHLAEARLLTGGAQVSQQAPAASSGSSTKPGELPGGASTDKALGRPAPGQVAGPHTLTPTGPKLAPPSNK